MITAFWDIDGTLLQNPLTRADLFAETIAAMGVVPVPPSGVVHGLTDRRLAELHLAASGLAPERLGEYQGLLDELSVEFYGHTPRLPVPGAREAVQLTRAAGWRNGLLTGNSPVRARTKLATAGFDLDSFDWDCFASGAFVSDRAELGRQARRLAGAGPLVVLGDTALDLVAAQAADATFVLVSLDQSVLADLGGQAEVAVASLADPRFAGFVAAFDSALA